MDSAAADKKLVGEVTHFFGKISVAVVDLKKPLRKGDTILIEGATTRLRQRADSIQYNHKFIAEARPGLSVGLKVADRVREHDKVFVLRPGLATARKPARPKARRPAKRVRARKVPARKVRSTPRPRLRRPARARARPKARRPAARRAVRARRRR